MTYGEWLEDLKLRVYEWPLWLKLSMSLPGALGGYIFARAMGLNVRPWIVAGGLFGLFLPFFVIFLLGVLWIVMIVGLIFVAIRLAFGPEAGREFWEYWAAILGGIWTLVKAVFHWAFG